MGVHFRRFLSLVITTMAHAEGQHHPAAGQAHAAAHHEVGQQHPLGIYLKIWGLLFVLSTASYLVDYFHFHGYLRWTLIVIFMLLKAGLIVAVFMHMLWERLAIVYAILVPPLLLLTLLGIGTIEGDYTFLTRGTFFGVGPAAPVQGAGSAAPVQGVGSEAPVQGAGSETPVQHR
jgi:cytochrome c oxidase subunit 4